MSDSRKEFEAWAYKKSNGWASFEIDSSNEYKSDKLDMAYSAFQEQQKKIDAAEKILNSIVVYDQDKDTLSKVNQLKELLK